MIWLRPGRVCRYKVTTTVLVDKRLRKADDRGVHRTKGCDPPTPILGENAEDSQNHI